MRRGRAVQLGLPSPDGALLRLHVSELDDERLWEVMSAMGLHDKVSGSSAGRHEGGVSGGCGLYQTWVVRGCVRSRGQRGCMRRVCSVQVTLVTVIPLRSLAAPLSLQMCCLGVCVGGDT